MKEFDFVSVNADYTGGGIWIFTGRLSGGLYFLTSNDPLCTDYAMILNADPDDFDVSLFEDWQAAHTVSALRGASGRRFWRAMLSALPAAVQDDEIIQKLKKRVV